MTVTVRYMAQLKQSAGTASEEVSISGTVRDLLNHLAESHTDLKRLLMDASGNLQSTILVFLGEEQVEHPNETQLTDGAVVTLLSPIAGG